MSSVAAAVAAARVAEAAGRDVGACPPGSASSPIQRGLACGPRATTRPVGFAVMHGWPSCSPPVIAAGRTDPGSQGPCGEPQPGAEDPFWPVVCGNTPVPVRQQGLERSERGHMGSIWHRKRARAVTTCMAAVWPRCDQRYKKKRDMARREAGLS